MVLLDVQVRVVVYNHLLNYQSQAKFNLRNLQLFFTTKNTKYLLISKNKKRITISLSHPSPSPSTTHLQRFYNIPKRKKENKNHSLHAALNSTYRYPAQTVHISKDSPKANSITPCKMSGQINMLAQ